MKTIILDTNTLMSIGQFKLDVFSELKRICDFRYEIVVLEGCIRELKNIIAEQKGKHQLNAKLALDILTKKKIKILGIGKEKEFVDDTLVNQAEKGAIIVTQDKILKERIKKVDGQVITIRQKKKLVLI